MSEIIVSLRFQWKSADRIFNRPYLSVSSVSWQCFGCALDQDGLSVSQTPKYVNSDTLSRGYCVN